jgi:hypothetical protein
VLSIPPLNCFATIVGEFRTASLNGFIRKNNSDDYISTIKLINQKTNKVFTNKLNYIFIELDKFTKELNQLENNQDKWLYLIKNIQIFLDIPLELQGNTYEFFIKKAELYSLNTEERGNYFSSLRNARDWSSIEETAYNNGINSVSR